MPAGAGETEGAHRHLGPEDGNAAPAGLGAALAHSLHTWSIPWGPRLCWARRTACDVHKADPHLRGVHGMDNGQACRVTAWALCP